MLPFLNRMSSVASDSSYRYSAGSGYDSAEDYSFSYGDEEATLTQALKDSSRDQIFEAMQHERGGDFLIAEGHPQNGTDVSNEWAQVKNNTEQHSIDNTARLFQLCEDGGPGSCAEVARILELDQSLLESTLLGTLLTPLLLCCRSVRRQITSGKINS